MITSRKNKTPNMEKTMKDYNGKIYDDKMIFLHDTCHLIFDSDGDIPYKYHHVAVEGLLLEKCNVMTINGEDIGEGMLCTIYLNTSLYNIDPNSNSNNRKSRYSLSLNTNMVNTLRAKRKESELAKGKDRYISGITRISHGFSALAKDDTIESSPLLHTTTIVHLDIEFLIPKRIIIPQHIFDFVMNNNIKKTLILFDNKLYISDTNKNIDDNRIYEGIGSPMYESTFIIDKDKVSNFIKTLPLDNIEKGTSYLLDKYSINNSFILPIALSWLTNERMSIYKVCDILGTTKLTNDDTSKYKTITNDKEDIIECMTDIYFDRVDILMSKEAYLSICKRYRYAKRFATTNCSNGDIIMVSIHIPYMYKEDIYNIVNSKYNKISDEYLSKLCYFYTGKEIDVFILSSPYMVSIDKGGEIVKKNTNRDVAINILTMCNRYLKTDLHNRFSMSDDPFFDKVMRHVNNLSYHLDINGNVLLDEDIMLSKRYDEQLRDTSCSDRQ